jgi:halimadienyl-diphosphate synthase
VTSKLKPHIDFLSNAWVPRRGVGFATNYSVKDSDDSVITYSTLLRFGIEKDLASMLAYEEKDHFRCFDLEVNPSISANIHILDALRQTGLSQKNSSVQKIISFLRRMKNDRHFWVDKWHSSAYYPTAHAIIACAGFENELVRESVEWLLHSQNANGSWGTYIPTAEETAYALQALWTWNEKVAKIPKAAFRNGVRWLEEHIDPPYPPLWIGKCLYNPRLVIRSAVISALTLAHQIL